MVLAIVMKVATYIFSTMMMEAMGDCDAAAVAVNRGL